MIECKATGILIELSFLMASRLDFQSWPLFIRSNVLSWIVWTPSSTQTSIFWFNFSKKSNAWGVIQSGLVPMLTAVNEKEFIRSKYKTLVSNLQQGFIAQEVKTAVFEETGSNNAFGGLKIGDITEKDKSVTSEADDFGRVDYEQFVAPLVKAVQQLSAKIDLLEARVDELEAV